MGITYILFPPAGLFLLIGSMVLVLSQHDSIKKITKKRVIDDMYVKKYGLIIVIISICLCVGLYFAFSGFELDVINPPNRAYQFESITAILLLAILSFTLVNSLKNRKL